MSEIKGNVRVEVMISLNPDRLEEMEYKLAEELEENNHLWRVTRTSKQLRVVAKLHAGEMHNGSTTALSEVLAGIDSALSDISDIRWFDKISGTAVLMTTRDEEDEEEEN